MSEGTLRARQPYFLGCPMWSNKGWVGQFFTRAAKPAEFLAQYSSALNSVEGNTTFYAMPPSKTVAKWRDAVAEGFRFCFKFPRVISHDLGLRDAAEQVHRFFTAMAPMGDKLGPFFLQLPPRFENMDALARFLMALPDDFAYVVEVRGAAFYGDLESEFEDLLGRLQMDRVIFDTHRLMTLATDDPELKDAQRRKPKSPVRTSALGPHPVLRYVGRPHIEEDREVLARWAERVAGWIAEGRTPLVFMHQAPDDVRAPELCRIFHDLLTGRIPGLPPLPDWPIDGEEPEPVQLSLF